MPTRTAWTVCAIVSLAIVTVGCQRSSEIAGEAIAPAVEQLEPDGSAAPATVASLSDSKVSPDTIDAPPMASREIATDAIQPHMTIDGGSGIYVAFIHQGNISVSTSRDQGATFSEPVIAIDVGGRARGGAHRGPRIGVDDSGTLTVTAPVTFDDAEYEKRYPTADLFFVRSSDAGKTWSEPQQVNEVAKQAPESLHWMTVAPNGEAHIAWLDRRDRKQSGQDIYFATVVDGKVGANVRIASTVCECCAPGLAVDGSGNPFVAYREGGSKPSREIFGLWSSNRGRSFAEAFQINEQNTLENG